MTQTYNTIKYDTGEMNETNDCAVKALAIVGNLPYRVAHAALKDAGRKNRRGTLVPQIEEATKTLGLKTLNKVDAPRKVTGAGYTACTIPTLYPTGRHIVYTRGHVFALIEGIVQDWTAGRRHRITGVVTICNGEATTPAIITPPKPTPKPVLLKVPKIGTACYQIWATAEALKGDRALVMTHCILLGINKGTVATQFAKWKRFHNQ